MRQGIDRPFRLQRLRLMPRFVQLEKVLITLLLLGLLPLGCGLNMQHHYRKFRPQLLQRDFEAANAFIEKRKKSYYGKKNRLLYYMDKAVVLHLEERYKESNAFLEKAKLAAEELWTESVSEQAAALLSTDNALSYQGEDFENVLVHYLGALNYIALGDLSAARVEARQVGQKLELLNGRYDADKKNAYKDDAFARWLSGKLALTEGTYAGYNDAWIDFRKALQVYRDDYEVRYHTALPEFLLHDALRTLEFLGNDFSAELSALRNAHPGIEYTSAEQARTLGEVVFIHNAGEAPYKVDRFWTGVAGDDIVRVAYPEFVTKDPVIVGSRMRINGVEVSSELAEDIAHIAVQNLEDHMTRIKTKAIARAVAKYIAGHMMAGADDANRSSEERLLSAVWNIGQAVAEEADKRSWITLPAQVRIAQAFVEPGAVVVEVDLIDHGGRVMATKTFEGTVEAGKTLFLNYRTFR